ncbi:MAG: hypothetical protein U0V70_15780 [Terriglobia bacterium]
MAFSIRRKLIFPLLAVGLALVASLLLIELSYRLQVIDFYRPELMAFNPKSELDGSSPKPTLLVFGDSFSAWNESYVNILRNRMPCLRVINSSISGSGIVQVSLIARSRIERFEPSLLLVQIYVGNDLFDITYPTNWKTLSLSRNLYWGFFNEFRSLSFINYRLGQVNASALAQGYHPYPSTQSVYRSDEQFSPDKFQSNEKLLLRADSRLIEKQILLLDDRVGDFNFLVKKLEWLSTIKGPHCTLYLLVIPHACQVSQAYFARTRILGAEFEYPNLIEQVEYPFVQHLRQRMKEARVINPLHIFREAEKSGTALFWPNDIHLNPNGNEVLAKYVESELVIDPSLQRCNSKN